MIALTKLDECEAMPAELSTLALEGSGVSLLTGTNHCRRNCNCDDAYPGAVFAGKYHPLEPGFQI